MSLSARFVLAQLWFGMANEHCNDPNYAVLFREVAAKNFTES